MQPRRLSIPVEKPADNGSENIATDPQVDFVVQLLLYGSQSARVVFECDWQPSSIGCAELREPANEDIPSLHETPFHPLGRIEEVFKPLAGPVDVGFAQVLEPFPGPVNVEFALLDAGLEVVDLEGNAVLYKWYPICSCNWSIWRELHPTV